MSIEWFRHHCLSLPHTTEHVLWGDDLVFKIGGKMYAAAPLTPNHKVWMSFKCSAGEFAELIERPGVIPAPYSARAHWVALETEDALTRKEIKRRINSSYELVFGKLTKKTQAGLRKPAKAARAR